MERIRVAVATTGGDAPGMNACLRAVAKSVPPDVSLVGVRQGAAGLLKLSVGRFALFSANDCQNSLDRAGTILGTSRVDPITLGVPHLNREALAGIAERIADNLQRKDISGILLLGGDSTATVGQLVDEACGGRIAVVVVPATIDNDVAKCAQTIGFDTAVNAVVDTVDNIRQTAAALNRTFVVEVMGKDCGAIAATAAIATGAEEVLVPEESPYSSATVSDVLDRLTRNRNRSNIVIVAEGSSFDHGLAGSSAADQFIALLSHADPSVDVRRLVVGHQQRGARPSSLTRLLASQAGIMAMDELARSARRLKASGHATARARMVAVGADLRPSLVRIGANATRDRKAEIRDLLVTQRRLAY